MKTITDYKKYPKHVGDKLDGHYIVAYIRCPACGQETAVTTTHISPNSGEGGYPYKRKKCPNPHCSFSEHIKLLNF